MYLLNILREILAGCLLLLAIMIMPRRMLAIFGPPLRRCFDEDREALKLSRRLRSW